MCVEQDLVLLRELGRRLETEPEGLRGASVRDLLMRSLLKIRDKQGRLAPFVLNRAQREFQRRCGRRNIVLKARQLGLTTYVAGKFFVETVTRPGTLTVQVAHDQRSAEEIFRIVHRFLENLPEGLRKGALVTSRANVRQIVFPKLDSEYRVETAADPNAGRGLTIRNLHCSEVARWPGDAAETLASLRAAVPPDGCLVLESTPAGAGGCFYEEWQRAGVTGYVRHFFPWWWEGQYRRDGVSVGELSDDERELVERYSLDEAQIAFRREVRANFGSRAAEEFAEDAESCFLASGECVFDIEVIERRLRECAPAVQSRENGRLQVWWPAQRGREYIVGVDAAGGGTEGDFACAQVIERETGLQCAEFYGHCTPSELARKSAELAREYGRALLVVERNNHGHAVLAQLATVERYDNVYRTRDGQWGWLTSVATRPRMIENLAAVLRAAPELFSSERLLAECRTFVRHRDGSTAAASGAHDDAVMAMAVALEARRLGERS